MKEEKIRFSSTPDSFQSSITARKQDGYRIAYLNRVYVLSDYRHKEIGQGLFKELEKDCRENDIYEYCLINAKNTETDKFYHSFDNVTLYEPPMLSKELKY